jgi:hypothetical protein
MPNFGSGLILQESRWTNFKAIAITAKALKVQYEDTGVTFDIFAVDGEVVYRAQIFQGAVPGVTDYTQGQNDSDKSDFTTNYQSSANVAILPVAGSLTDTQLRASAVPVSLTSTTITGSVAVTGPLTDTQLRASAVPVSGTVAATQSGTWTVQPGNTANTTAWKVDGSAVTQPVSGTITANIGTSGSLALDATLTGGTQTTRITDGTNTATVKAASTAAVATDKALVVAISPNNSLTTTVSGTVTVTGTVTANIGTSGSLALDASVTGLQVFQGSTTSGQKGGLTLGAVTTAAPSYTTAQSSPLSLTTAGLLRVDGSGVTQPVSLTSTTITGTVAISAASLPLPTGASTAAKQPALGTAGSASADVITIQGIASMTALKVDGSAVTQPVSGTITANIGTSGSLALDATLTGGTQTTRITDGTNTATVKAASTAAVATDKALVVAISPNNSLTIATGDTTGGTGSLNALNATATVATAGKLSCSMNFSSASSPLLTVVPELSFDGGTTWFLTVFITYNSAGFYQQQITVSSVTNPTATATYGIKLFDGVTNARVRVSAYTSGSISATLKAVNVDTSMPRDLTLETSLGDIGIKTSTFNGTTQSNPGFKNAFILIILGIVSGTTPTMNVQLQYSPDSGSHWINIGGASSNVTATGNTIAISLGSVFTTSGATQTLFISGQLVKTWRLVYTIGGTTPSFTIASSLVSYSN